MWNKSKQRRRGNLGKPFKSDPRHPKKNCHVFIVWGKRWVKYGKKGLHYFWKEAVQIAKDLAKLPKNAKAWILVKRKQTILWSSKDHKSSGAI